MNLWERLLQTGRLSAAARADRGPYHRAAHPERTHITEGRPGVPLQLALRLLHADGRTPPAGAVIDVWQAENVPDDLVAPQETFLRRGQRTDEDGIYRDVSSRAR